MKFLIVLAHPLKGSFAESTALAAKETLLKNGHEVDLLNLYEEDFDPRLTVAERGGYFDTPYDASAVAGIVARLQAADGLILVFPQWWFNFPAILKGFFDRIFVPGVAFDHDLAGGRIIPRLTNIKYLWALTTTGSPWWLVKLYMGNPVKRLLKRGIGEFCAKKAEFPDDLAARHGPGDAGEARSASAGRPPRSGKPLMAELVEWLLSPMDPSRMHQVDWAISWHGRLMVLAWLFAFPAGILIARFFKITPKQNWPTVLDNVFWWKQHLRLQYLGGVVRGTGDADRADAVHVRRWIEPRPCITCLGWCVVFATAIQFVAGWLRGTKGGPTKPAADGSLRGDHYDMTLRRVIFEYVHKTVGYVVLLTAWFTIALGTLDRQCAALDGLRSRYGHPGSYRPVHAFPETRHGARYLSGDLGTGQSAPGKRKTPHRLGRSQDRTRVNGLKPIRPCA